MAPVDGGDRSSSATWPPRHVDDIGARLQQGQLRASMMLSVSGVSGSRLTSMRVARRKASKSCGR
jgi:hypothetical protein